MFGNTLKKLRKEKNEKQETIANLCNVATNTISNWENNVTQPTLEQLKKLAKHFNVTIDYLLGVTYEDYDKIKELKKLLKENGITNIEQAMKIIEALKEQTND